MKRERRYIVMKFADMAGALTVSDLNALAAIGAKIDIYRRKRGARPMDCVVVESDWPEFEPTWAAIERRVDSANDKDQARGSRAGSNA